MASLMRWALALLVGFLVVQLGSVFISGMGLGTVTNGVVVLVSFAGAVWLGMVVIERGD